MKYLKFLPAILCLAMVSISPVVLAQEAAAPAKMTSIAVVDIQQLMTESQAAKSIQKQVQSFQQNFLEDLRKKEEVLREKEKTLMDQRGTLSKEEFAKQRNEFEAQLIEARQYAQKRKNDLEEGSALALNTLRDEVLKVVQNIADSESYDLVLSKQHVVLGSKSIDVSDEALKQLNAAIDDVKVTIAQ